MLQTDHRKRPSCNQILQTSILIPVVERLLGKEEKEKELSHTVFHGTDAGDTPEGYDSTVLFIKIMFASKLSL